MKDRQALQLIRGAGTGVGRDLLRPMHEGDREILWRDLAPRLRRGYPGSDRWLEGRLDDVIRGEARSDLARDLHGLNAVTIETPKGERRLKLSTVWVAERSRGRGIGARLLAGCRERWLEDGIEEAWVTVSPEGLPSMARLLAANGFAFTAVEPDRYGPNRPETIFTWRPGHDAIPLARDCGNAEPAGDWVGSALAS